MTTAHLLAIADEAALSIEAVRRASSTAALMAAHVRMTDAGCPSAAVLAELERRAAS